MAKPRWCRMGLIVAAALILMNGEAAGQGLGPAQAKVGPDGQTQLPQVADRGCRGPGPANCGPIRHGAPVVVPPHRVRHHRNVVVVRPHGHFYPGYGHYHSDDDAYRWLAFTAITLKLLDVLNEQQQRAHEAAQVKATTAEVGETIVWNDGGAGGSVTVLRDGESTTGRYCREFQQEVTVGGKSEQAFGTACRQPDGAWEIISTTG